MRPRLIRGRYIADVKGVIYPLCAVVSLVALVRRVRVLRRGGANPQLAVMCERLEPLLVAEAPDMVLVYGDTTTTLARLPFASVIPASRRAWSGPPAGRTDRRHHTWRASAA